jgi:purine-binding chemotaxis protein CheW
LSAFAELVERFLYRPDEQVGPFLELAPEAEAIARPTNVEIPEEFLAFELSGELYAVPIAAVREILKVTHVTEVPRAEKNLIGLINVRGEMLPLYDVKVRLHLSQRLPIVRGADDVTRTTRIVLMRELEGDAGVLVDRVVGVVKLSLSRLEAPPALGADRNGIAGLARKDGQLFILLDVEQALS